MDDRAVPRKVACHVLVAGFVVIAAACGSTSEDRSTGASSTSTTRTSASELPSSVVASSRAPSSVVTSSDAELTTSAPAATATEPSSAASSDRPGPMSLCAAPEAPHVIAFDRSSGDIRWVACGEEAGYRHLEQVSDGIVYVLHVEQPDPNWYSAFDAGGGHLVTDAPPPPPRIQTTIVDGITISGGQDDPTSATDANGRVLWSHPGHWVYDDVAAIADGAVFALEYLDAGGSQLVAYEIDTGEVRWSTPDDSGLVPWELSPWAAANGQLFAGWTNLYVRNTTDGTPIWSTDWSTIGTRLPTAHISGLDVDDDTVYVGIATELGPGD